MLSSPTIIPELVLAVTSPDGKYVVHCGMWYRPGDDYAYVEPVATVPEYRMMTISLLNSNQVSKYKLTNN